jgi:hypothetical protein
LRQLLVGDGSVAQFNHGDKGAREAKFLSHRMLAQATVLARVSKIPSDGLSIWCHVGLGGG